MYKKENPPPTPNPDTSKTNGQGTDTDRGSKRELWKNIIAEALKGLEQEQGYIQDEDEV